MTLSTTLIQKYGGDPTVADVAALARRFEYKDFPQFIEAWSWQSRFLREYDVKEAQGLGIVGIGIGGSEHKYPPAPFKPLYEAARSMGFHTTAHAGEAAGASSIWDTIRELQVERIGHGTRAWEDPELVEHLIAHRIPVEMCPVSNVRTGVVRCLREHPIRRYFEAGMLVTVNTDDPKMFQTRLADEYRLLEQECGFSKSDRNAQPFWPWRYSMHEHRVNNNIPLPPFLCPHSLFPAPVPSVETLGYYRSSLRDSIRCGHTRATHICHR